MENHLGPRVLKTSGIQGPLEVHKDSSMPPTTHYRDGEP